MTFQFDTDFRLICDIVPPHDDVIKWKHFCVTGTCAGHSPATGEFPAQRPVTRSFDVFLSAPWINGWVNNREAGDLRRHRAHYDVIVMDLAYCSSARCPQLRQKTWRPRRPHGIIRQPAHHHQAASAAAEPALPGPNASYPRRRAPSLTALD